LLLYLILFALLIKQLKADVLFLDFDRTLCGTKFGAAPIYPKHAPEFDLLKLAKNRLQADFDAKCSSLSSLSPLSSSSSSSDCSQSSSSSSSPSENAFVEEEMKRQQLLLNELVSHTLAAEKEKAEKKKSKQEQQQSGGNLVEEEVCIEKMESMVINSENSGGDNGGGALKKISETVPNDSVSISSSSNERGCSSSEVLVSPKEEEEEEEVVVEEVAIGESSVYIITRNSHVKEIKQWLKCHGCDPTKFPVINVMSTKDFPTKYIHATTTTTTTTTDDVEVVPEDGPRLELGVSVNGNITPSSTTSTTTTSLYVSKAHAMFDILDKREAWLQERSSMMNTDSSVKKEEDVIKCKGLFVDDSPSEIADVELVQSDRIYRVLFGRY
jgi:hypothetical protein